MKNRLRALNRALDRTSSAGFTLTELTIVIVVIGVLAGITYSVAGGSKHKEKAYYARANSEMGNIANALKLYVVKYNNYPPDVNRAIPPGLEEFLQDTGGNQAWKYAPWPGSVYDYDYWPPDAYSTVPTIQISVHFCDIFDTATCKQNFPKASYVTDQWTWESSVYYCIQGACRSHRTQPPDWPGYCINCGNNGYNSI